MNEKIKTPESYVELMLNEAGYTHNIYGKSVLENSCGDGNILSVIVERYICDAKRNGIGQKELEERLEKDVCGYEIDQKLVKKCRDRLNQVAVNYCLDTINWNIRQEDFLEYADGQYDFVFSNPPYITYHDLTEEQRESLRTSFDSCKIGRFDYYYAFIEKSLNVLNSKGIMVFLVPFSIFRNQYAESIRSKLLPGLEKVIDLRGKMIFPNILVSAAIIRYSRNNESPIISYQCEATKSLLFIEKKQLTGKWRFSSPQNSLQSFGEYFTVQNSIATLCNKAYLFEPTSEDEKYYHIGGKYRIEKMVAFPAVSTKTSRSKKKQMIIVPYFLYSGGYTRYSPKEFSIKFPKAEEYLKTRETELANRDVDKNCAWFEYGRSQALTSVIGNKLVVSMVATRQYHTVLAKKDEIPFAGYFVKAKDGTKESLLKAKSILESSSFYQYICECGTPTTIDSYRISVKDILDYPIEGL